jgi:hypothetical protein
MEFRTINALVVDVRNAPPYPEVALLPAIVELMAVIGPPFVYTMPPSDA